uniref:SH3 domain-containing protein n=1 Tax=Strigops habroptila TaxID=2489341 RepID=A0A672TPT8_STRHB
MEAIAKFDFSASGEDELSFQAGDMLKVSAAPGISESTDRSFCASIFLDKTGEDAYNLG